MAIQIFSKQKQARGNFNYGEILENKPIEDKKTAFSGFAEKRSK